jgi:hypothetical protein
MPEMLTPVKNKARHDRAQEQVPKAPDTQVEEKQGPFKPPGGMPPVSPEKLPIVQRPEQLEQQGNVKADSSQP